MRTLTDTTVEVLTQRAAMLSTMTGERFEVRKYDDGDVRLIEHTTNNEFVIAETIDEAMFFIRGAVHANERAAFMQKHAA